MYLSVLRRADVKPVRATIENAAVYQAGVDVAR
jgi:hypothetical protein